MDHALIVGISEGIRRTRDDRRDLVERKKRAGLGERHKVAAFEKLHCDKREIVLFASVVYGDDILVREPARRLGFPEKAFFHFRQFIRLELLRQRHCLNRNHAADFRILAEINNAHRAFA